LPPLSEPDARTALCAGWVTLVAVWDARLRAVCCRPRAWPPFFAAAFFAAARRFVADALVERLDESLREEPDLPRALADDFLELDALPPLERDLLAALLLLREEPLRVWAMVISSLPTLCRRPPRSLPRHRTTAWVKAASPRRLASRATRVRVATIAR